MQITADDPLAPDVLALLDAHVAAMRKVSPPGSVHALDPTALVSPGITFWTARDRGALLGCGALKQLDETHGELKSMRVVDASLRRGIARVLLDHVVEHARRTGFRRLSLETGSTEDFLPARNLYAHAGFIECGPFADYVCDPHSTFMTRVLQPGMNRANGTLSNDRTTLRATSANARSH